ncbi:hypothetical protein UK23_06140 [Lentzea aerocolonigenes]|uniref:Glycoside hydrolase family 3 N-terminal domain-containing protein n=1 Tax=Lentzea aerocolonigenes TaxID=68170 RepID=A0A0F0HA06_LENAE|nr:hypothetical protein UK23_06140 [Lentzea aerocolonigenes]
MVSYAELVNSCLLPSYGGADPGDWWKRELDNGLAGLVLFGADLGPLNGEVGALATGKLRAHRPDMIIALDEEGGDITRAEYHRGSNYPGNLALGAVDDPALTGAVAEAIAADLIDLGVSVNLAPSVDVCPGAHLPVLGTRSFHADPARVAEHACAFVDGLQKHGVAATAKHFPGLGSTSTDSHFALPSVDDPEEVLRARDLVPFAATVRAGVRAVMTGHVLAAAVDSTPATFSRRFVTDILRGELGFGGVVISDALDMEPARAGRGFAGAAVRAWQAGVDLMILGPRDGERICAEIREGALAAIEDGTLPLARLEEAAGRVADLRKWSGEPRRPAADLSGTGIVAARRALAVRGEPPAPGRWFVVELRPEPSISCGTVPWGLIKPLTRLGGVSGAIEVPEGAAGVELPDGPVVVVVRADSERTWQDEALARILRRRPDAVVVDMGYCDVPVPPGTVVLKTFGAGLVNAVAASELLSGRRTAGAPRDC